MVEYIDQRINYLSWQIADVQTDVISGSKTGVSIWHFVDSPGAYDQLPIAELVNEPTKSGVCKANLIGSLALSACNDGTVLLHELAAEPGRRMFLKLISKTTDLHKGYKCNDMLFCAQTNSVITCGNDGAISSFHIEHPDKSQTKRVSESSLKCMDLVTPNEVICCTLSGCLKYFDLRTYECIGTFASKNLSSLTCIQRNPHVNHLATGGNDLGSLVTYDLRNQPSALSQISAHSAAITCVRYHPKSPNTCFSSSCDGEIFKWNLNQPKKVESIVNIYDPLSIVCFDINQVGDVVYTTDHGAIFYNKLSDIGQ